MTYATAGDMSVRFGAGEVEDLAPGASEGTIDMDRVVGALGDAAAEIDAAVSAFYALPLGPGPWPLLRSLGCDLARYRLYDNSVPEAVADRAKVAREVLKRVGDGEIALLDAAGKEAPRTAAVRHEGPEPVMTGTNLKGLTL